MKGASETGATRAWLGVVVVAMPSSAHESFGVPKACLLALLVVGVPVMKQVLWLCWL